MDDLEKIRSELVQVARLASESKDEDLRLYLARLVRRYRRSSPELSKSIEEVLVKSDSRSARTREEIRFPEVNTQRDEPDIPLIRPPRRGETLEPPILDDRIKSQFEMLIQEWKHVQRLRGQGLAPTSSVILTGPPGVGKTYSARWLSGRLKMPMYSLDLTAVMSSRLGQTGSNLRAVLDFARREPSVLFLDEVDSIAKRRSDDADVGELKRLVTIMLQELDEWPSTSLVIAATNHPELVDRALWRRFEVHIDFPEPSQQQILNAIQRYLGDCSREIAAYVPALELILAGSSISEVERQIKLVRKSFVLGGDPSSSIAELLRDTVSSRPRAERIAIARELRDETDLSQHKISRLTAVSRDTIRKDNRSTGSRRHG